MVLTIPDHVGLDCTMVYEQLCHFGCNSPQVLIMHILGGSPHINMGVLPQATQLMLVHTLTELYPQLIFHILDMRMEISMYDKNVLVVFPV